MRACTNWACVVHNYIKSTVSYVCAMPGLLCDAEPGEGTLTLPIIIYILLLATVDKIHYLYHCSIKVFVGNLLKWPICVQTSSRALGQQKWPTDGLGRRTWDARITGFRRSGPWAYIARCASLHTLETNGLSTFGTNVVSTLGSMWLARSGPMWLAPLSQWVHCATTDVTFALPDVYMTASVLHGYIQVQVCSRGSL